MIVGRHTASRLGQGVVLTLLVVLSSSAFQFAPAKHEVSNAHAPVLVASAAGLACFSDGVACSHSVDCCSGGCVGGRCGTRNKLKRRLARR